MLYASFVLSADVCLLFEVCLLIDMTYVTFENFNEFVKNIFYNKEQNLVFSNTPYKNIEKSEIGNTIAVVTCTTYHHSCSISYFMKGKFCNRRFICT